MVGLLVLSPSASPALTVVQPWTPLGGILIRGATVVAMDTGHSVITDGSVLVRRGKIVAVWQGAEQPPGVAIGDPSVISLATRTLSSPA